MDGVDPRETPSSATEIIRNCLPVSQLSHFSQNLSKSYNLDIRASRSKYAVLTF